MSNIDPIFDMKRAIIGNIHFAERLGWGKQPVGSPLGLNFIRRPSVVVDILPDRDWPLKNLIGTPVGSDSVALAVIVYQRLHRNLTADGVLGPLTLAHMMNTPPAPIAGDHIVINGKDIPFPWPVHSFDENDGLSLVDVPKTWRKRKHQINRIVVHWDAAISARSCFQIFLKRGVSSHFNVDVEVRDGKLTPVLFQYLDPLKHVAFHAGDYNNRSIGIDLSNAVDKEYADRYIKMFGVPRPDTKGTVQGMKKDILGFYPEQIELFRDLCTILRREIPTIGTNVPDRPLEESPDCIPQKWGGVCGHLNLTKRKWDPGPETGRIVRIGSGKE